MGILEHFFILLLSISGIFTDTASRSIGTGEVLNEDLYSSKSRVRRADTGFVCSSQCADRYNRVCSNEELPVPLACGGCVAGFTEQRSRDGMHLCRENQVDRGTKNKAEAPDQDIDRIVDLLQARQRDTDNKNTAESAPIGQHLLHRLQKVQHKLNHGNQLDQQRYQDDLLAQDPFIAQQLGYPPGNPDIDTYQPTEEEEAIDDLLGNEADVDEDAGYHSNKETVGYQKEHVSEEDVASEESPEEEEADELSSSVEEDEEEEKKEEDQERKEEIVYEHPPAPQHRVASKDRTIGAGDKVSSMSDVYFLAVVAGCSVAGVVGLIVAGVCWYRLQRNVKAASEAEYPAYGVTGPTQERMGSPGDRKLAQSAQMYHYQHQKQQMLAMEKANGDMTKDDEGDSEEENDEGDYTVYECPGLAPTGEMEVKNPLFSEETPVTPSDSHEEPK